MTTFIAQENLVLDRHFAASPSVDFRPGELVCDIERAREHVFWVSSGVSKVSILTALGMQRSLFYQTSGSLLGDVSCFAHPEDLAIGIEATALTALTAHRMTHVEFRRRCAEDPELANELIGWAYRKVASLIEEVQLAAFHDTASQLAALIWALWKENLRLEASSRPSLLSTTHQELASATGRSRVAITYAMSDLVEMGMIQSYRGRIEVLDPERLRDFARWSAREDQRG